MKNLVKLDGILQHIHKFSDKAGNIRVEVISQGSNGQDYKNLFQVTVFQDNLSKILAIPLGSAISIEGKLKNSSYEKDGQKIWKLEVLLVHFTAQPAEVGTPTRIANMSYPSHVAQQSLRSNSSFDESIPF